MTAGPGSRGDILSVDLARLTAAKTVANTALRWIPPFLPTIARGLDTSTTSLTATLGAGELAGLTTLAPRRLLDRGHERTVMTIGLVLVWASAVVALLGSLVAFAASVVLLVAGMANLTVAGHAWISHRVPFGRRARAIGVYETSWAFSLLVGAPIVAILINRFGWRGPFVAIAVGAAVAAGVVSRTGRGAAPSHVINHSVAPGRARVGLTPTARLVVAGAALLPAAAVSVFVVSGTWLDDAFGMSTSGLGLVAMALGGVELVASSSSAAFADRLGKEAAVLGGTAVLLVGLASMASAGDRQVLGVVALITTLMGFEFAFVTSLSLVSEAMPDARGATLGMANAVATVSRAAAMVAGGVLYDAHGIAGTVVFAAAAAVLAMACFARARVGVVVGS